MTGTVQPYKLAWLEGNTLHSSMHASQQEAERAASVIAAPKMIMKLQQMDGNTYSWSMLGGPWSWMARNYALLATAIAFVVLLLLYLQLKN